MHCPRCNTEYEGSPTECAHCGLIFGETTGTATALPERVTSRRKRIPVLIRGMVLTMLLLIGSAAMWFGGSYWERGKWDSKYEALESEKKTLKTQHDQVMLDYGQIREAVSARLGLGDPKAFVTPQDTTIAAQVDAIAGSLSGDVEEVWADYYRLYDWVAANITPSVDSALPILPDLPCNFMPELMPWRTEYWRMPAETLACGAGDCEDMALLLASMIMSYTEGRHTCWVVMWTSAYGFGHAAVAIPSSGGGLTVLDPAGKYSTGLGRYPSVSSSVDEWLANLPEEFGLYVSRVFSSIESQHFTSTSEFVDWAEARI